MAGCRSKVQLDNNGICLWKANRFILRKWNEHYYQSSHFTAMLAGCAYGNEQFYFKHSTPSKCSKMMINALSMYAQCPMPMGTRNEEFFFKFF